MIRRHTHRPLRVLALIGLVLTGSLTVARQTTHAASPVVIHFWMGPDTQGYTQKAVAMFNKMEQGKIKVVYDVQASDTGQYFQNVERALRAHSSAVDVIGGDVIWPAQLASRGYLLPVDKYFSKSDQKRYLSGPISDLTYKGHIYGAPWFTDYGLIYYRKDLLAKYKLPVPHTWQTLQVDARYLLSKHAVKEGFVFQGDQYEGLVCDALEYVWGAGGFVYGPHASDTVSKAARGLDEMRSMITTGATPKAVTTYQEPQTANDFVAGLAAFARNWPYMWAMAQDSHQSKIAGKVGVLPLMHSPGGQSYSTLGGWNLSINAYSKYPHQAWQFIKFMISPKMQRYFAINEGHTMALRSTYDDKDVLKANPWFKTVIPMLNIRPRPTSPVYNDISLQMQKDFHGVLDGSMSSRDAVTSIDSFIKQAESRFH